MAPREGRGVAGVYRPLAREAYTDSPLYNRVQRRLHLTTWRTQEKAPAVSNSVAPVDADRGDCGSIIALQIVMSVLMLPIQEAGPVLDEGQLGQN